MYLWTPPTPDRDGTMDAEIVVHEIGHGIMNRLHTLGTAGTQGGQMHEGTGDFLAHLLLSEASDPINGIYTTGGYSTQPSYRCTLPQRRKLLLRHPPEGCHRLYGRADEPAAQSVDLRGHRSESTLATVHLPRRSPVLQLPSTTAEESGQHVVGSQVPARRTSRT